MTLSEWRDDPASALEWVGNFDYYYYYLVSCLKKMIVTCLRFQKSLFRIVYPPVFNAVYSVAMHNPDHLCALV